MVVCFTSLNWIQILYLLLESNVHLDKGVISKITARNGFQKFHSSNKFLEYEPRAKSPVSLNNDY